jgi:3-oxoacyl-[acyl-carrier protein] reductase
LRALVTGASRGIGRETALLLAGEGTEVALHYHRHRQEARALQTQIERLGGSCFLVQGDLGRASDADRISRAVAERWRALDVLVNNAGNYPRRSFAATTDRDLSRTIEENLLGPARLTRRLLPLLRRSRSGRIVFVSSVLAYTGSAHGAAYAAAKAGLLGLTRSLAKELAPGITVNAVAPGSIDTAILRGDSPAVRRRRERTIPMRRIGTAREVAQTILFLASERAAYVTGATLHVNGGTYSV